jgi:hypothetical protein
MMYRFTLTLIVASVSFRCIAQEWRGVTIAEGLGRVEEIEVANGRNDGINRIYTGTRGGTLYEFTYSNGRWNKEVICSGLQSFHTLVVGDGRNDGVNRVYGGTPLYELTFSGGTWVMQLIDSPGYVLSVQLGEGRNDGIVRLYAGGRFGLNEYTWTGSTWNKLVITSSSGGDGIWTISIGDGRNDGMNRLYAPEKYGFYVYEFSWNGSNYSKLSIGESFPRLAVVRVGPGRNDGINRIYVGCKRAHLYELTYNNGSWEKLDMTPNGPNFGRYGIRVGRVKSDGKFRVYTGIQHGDIREYTWNGTEYDEDIVDGVTSATAYLAIGDGRNDDTVRIYGTSYFARGVYEITHVSPYFVEESNFRIKDYGLRQIKPNPFIFDTEICFFVGHKAHLPVDLKIYDLAGREVVTLTKKEVPGTYRIKWDGRDSAGNRVSPGVYFCRLERKKSPKLLHTDSVSKKLILL